MWKCSACSKVLGDEAFFCSFCGKPKGQAKEKWYYRPSIFWISLLVVGPLALPLYWLNPKRSLRSKALMSVAVLALSVILGVLLAKSLAAIHEYYKMMFSY